MNNVGVGPRAVAIIIDTVILFVAGWIIALFFGRATTTGFHLSGGPALLFFLIALAYYIVMEAQKGATIGKLLLGLRVVNEDGGSIDWQASIVRNLLRIVDGLFIYLVGAILVWTSDKKQRLGDRLAKTIVIKK
ncbi:MAG: RDD family protein [Arenicellales bacterium]|jgi:uncharacterized RDD family membrane protein YckC